MAISYSWEIVQLESYPKYEGKTDVVFVIHWKRKAVNGDKELESYGSCGVPYDPTNTFKPLNQLTQADVEQWLVNELGDSLADIDNNFVRRFNESAGVNAAPPWSK
jgi:hypothetical protein